MTSLLFGQGAQQGSCLPAGSAKGGAIPAIRFTPCPAAPAPVGPATGADAGTPGSFTPTGADVPAALQNMASVTANPATAWTTGQYVVLGDGSHAYWNGTGWIAGQAP